MQRAISCVFVLWCAIGLASAVGGEELQTVGSMSTQREVDAVDLERYLAPEKQRTPSKTPVYNLELVEDDPLSAVEPESESHGSPALLYFNPYDNGDSIINGFLCAYLSDEIYADGLGYSQEWEDDFRLRLMAEGAEDVTFEHNATYGAELAAVWLPNAVIIVCRGSHMNGSTSQPWRDWIVDADDDAIQREIGGFKCHVHEGVWNATSSVYNWIRATALVAASEGRRVWLTGHSLGAATATIASARLHYDDGVPVQGLQTYGSFKVGDRDFKKVVEMPGADGGGISEFIQRWAVNGDFATTLFFRDFVPYKTRLGGTYRYYEHVGRTHQITRSGTFGAVDWDVDFDTEENTNMFALPDSVLPLGEHGDYFPALRMEIQRQLSAPAEQEVLDDLLRLE